MKVFILIFLVITQALVGGFILKRKSKTMSRLAFSHALHLISSALFALGIVVFSFQPLSDIQMLWWGRFLYGFSFLGGTTFMAFSYILTKNTYEKYISRFTILFSLVFFVLTFLTNIVVQGAESETQKLLYGNNLVLLVLIQPGPYIVGIINLIQHYIRTNDKIEKKQIQIISLGMTPAIGLAAFVNFFIPVFFESFEWFWLGVFSLLGCSIATTYIIQRYRFFDIKSTISITVKKVLAFTLSFLVILFPLVRYTDILQSTNQLLLVAGLFALFTLLYSRLIKFFNSETFHQYFGISNLEYFRQIIDGFRNTNFMFKNIKDLEGELKDMFEKKLHIQKVHLHSNNKECRKKYPKLIKHIEKNSDILVTKELIFLQQDQGKKFRFLKELRELGEVCIPLINSTQKFIGFCILGKKEFDDIYTADEINLLKTIKEKLSLSLTGIIYNEELEQEVAEKTKVLNQQKKRLQKANKELKKLDEMKDSFLSVASHELRTPMTVIKGYSEFLLSEKFGKLNKKQTKFQNKIFHNTQQLLDLVNDILDLSKLDAERMVFNISEVKAKEFLDDALSNFKLLCEKKDITLKLKVEKSIHTMKTDPDKIQRILNNLVGNAYKFTPEKGSITIKLSPYKKDSAFLHFEIIDTGIGLSKEDQPKVFQKFQQVANYLQTPYNGTGLGLPIVKKIIEKLGGKIWVESELEKGSNFQFLIPIVPPKI